MSKRETNILSHCYDGIREYDNPLPGWWLAIFYGSMVWSLLYALFFHLGPGLLNKDAHDAEMRELAIEAARAAITAGEVRPDVGRHDPVGQVLDESHVSLSNGGVRVTPIVTRYAWPSELDLMARIAGLRLKDRWSGWNREAFTSTSERHVSVYGR